MSNVNGTLACPIPDANLYLINPAGVVFGPDAKLDLQGSFAVTTADYLKLADGGRFHAAEPAKSVPTSAGPAAFGFLGPQKPAAIEMRGRAGHPDSSTTAYSPELEVRPGKSVAVVGGDVTIIGGALRAPEGRIEVLTAGSAGEVAPDSASAIASRTDNPAQPPAAPAQWTGAVTLSGAALMVNGRKAVGSGTGGNGGLLIIRAGSLTAADALIGAYGGDGFGGGAGGRVDVTAGGAVSLSGGSAISADGGREFIFDGGGAAG